MMTLLEFAQGFVRFAINNPGQLMGTAFVDYTLGLSQIVGNGFIHSSFDPFGEDEVSPEAWAYIERNLHYLHPRNGE